MNLDVTDATAVISSVRSLPLGAIVDSTPAIMNAPSLDPPPDDDYPAFAFHNKRRRSIIWVGTNNGILEGIDARFGVEVWGFIPLNLLPKLKTLRDGQPVGSFDFFVDGSPKISDVKFDGRWHTHLIIGEGPGGTFYQSFDVTMADMAAVLGGTTPDRDATIDSVLSYFANSGTITLNWAFPSYAKFDRAVSPYGDVSATASEVEKSVGQTWSDPVVGQVLNTTGPYSVLVGSGFLAYTAQQRANRAGTVAGTTFYILSARDGTLYDSTDVGSDGVNEKVDDCTINSSGCRQIKNALQSDPVATTSSDSRFVTKSYIGDLDGNLWRFDIGLNAQRKPVIKTKAKLYLAGSDQPIFSSIAAVNVGGTHQYAFFGTGSDLLPETDEDTVYHLLAVLDSGGTGSKTFDRPLTKIGNAAQTADERVTAFPALAGDIVFFTTTTRGPVCNAPNANLYAFTFTGGSAYDSTGDNKVTSNDSPLVKTITGQRATAPFIVDQHLLFGAGGKVLVFGDSTDFNNGIGKASVRILSWREVR
jgi:Tfp pilus tip-associated adhesin PilY1